MSIVKEAGEEVMIRIRDDSEGVVLDLRSVSRVGLGDLGTNAKRIRTFIEAFETQG